MDLLHPRRCETRGCGWDIPTTSSLEVMTCPHCGHMYAVCGQEIAPIQYPRGQWVRIGGLAKGHNYIETGNTFPFYADVFVCEGETLEAAVTRCHPDAIHWAEGGEADQ